jgi:hypothetical protein
MDGRCLLAIENLPGVHRQATRGKEKKPLSLGEGLKNWFPGLK